MATKNISITPTSIKKPIHVPLLMEPNICAISQCSGKTGRMTFNEKGFRCSMWYQTDQRQSQTPKIDG